MNLWRMIMPYEDPEHRKKYYQKNKEYIKKQSREYYHKNKEYYRKYKKENPWVRMTISAKRRTNLPFNITSEYVKSIWPEDNTCPALNIKFKQGTEGSPVDSSPSLDRIIPKLGYIKGNVQIVSHLANKIMNNATPDQVMAVAKHYKKITEKKNAA